MLSGDPQRLPSERDPADTASSGIGVLLREAREETSESLRGVSRTLRIRRIYLEAIEDGRFKDLPGPAYATGFIRTYADHLGLDSDEIIRRFREEAEDFGGKAELDFPVPVAESGIPGKAVLMVGLIAAAGAYGAWTFNASRESATADLIPPPPDHLVAEMAQATQASKEKTLAAVPEAQASPAVASDSPPSDDAPPSGETTAVSADGPPSGNTEAVIEAIANPAVPADGPAEVESSPSVVEASVQAASDAAEPEAPAPSPPVAEVTETPPAPSQPVAEIVETPPALSPPVVEVAETSLVSSPPPAPEPEAPPVEAGNEDAVQVAVIPPPPNMPADEPRRVRTYGEENTESRILLRARVNSWIQVRDDLNNRLLVTRLLRVGDSFRVPDRPGLKLLTGNAGGLDILVDGEVVPPIGPLGAVRRDVALDTVSLLQGVVGRN